MTYDILTQIFSWRLKNFLSSLKNYRISCKKSSDSRYIRWCSSSMQWYSPARPPVCLWAVSAAGQALPTHSIPRSLPADINECSTGVSGCQQTCTNTAGSFLCSCNSGFNLNSNGRTCSGEPEKLSRFMSRLQSFFE